MFHLRFDPSQVPHWAARYISKSTPTEMRRETDIEHRIAPTAKARGYPTKLEFLDICYWKSPRSKPLCTKNPDEFIRAVAATALSTPSERLRIEVLTLLSGVGWPMASAILHWIHPDPYPILDVRALWSVGWSRIDDKPSFAYDFDDWPPGVEKSLFVFDFEHWWEYTIYCRQLRSQCGVTMRDLDRALWQYAKEHMP